MANKKYEETDIQAIADTIREKTGSEESFKVRDMASGVNEVYEAGYIEGFRIVAEKTTKNVIVPSAVKRLGTYAFGHSSELETLYISDGVLSLGNQACQACTKLKTVRTPATLVSKLGTNIFKNCTRLHTITFGTVSFTDTTTAGNFDGCNSLTTIIIEQGEFLRSADFKYPPLSVASMKNIIEHLKDYAGTEYEFDYTLTLSSACKTALEAEGATAEYNGVACTWIELINNKKWNC